MTWKGVGPQRLNYYTRIGCKPRVEQATSKGRPRSPGRESVEGATSSRLGDAGSLLEPPPVRGVVGLGHGHHDADGLVLEAVEDGVALSFVGVLAHPVLPVRVLGDLRWRGRAGKGGRGGGKESATRRRSRERASGAGFGFSTHLLRRRGVPLVVSSVVLEVEVQLLELVLSVFPQVLLRHRLGSIRFVRSFVRVRLVTRAVFAALSFFFEGLSLPSFFPLPFQARKRSLSPISVSKIHT